MVQARRQTQPARAQALTAVKKAAYDRFQQALLQGRLRPGQIVSQRDLVAMMGLSIGALRELLPRLQAEGLLNVMPQRGIQITVVDLPLIRDAFQMRMALEREAVLTAIRQMPDAVLEAQRQIHLDVLERLKSNPSPELLDEGQAVDYAFHDLLVTATGNEFLIQGYQVNAIRVRLINLDRIRLNETILPSAFADHIGVIDAILARDRARAVEAIDAHIRNARERAIAL
ncbi:GntR family transcriptional regulator [Arsenicitalea aurantiaca]|uniref:GntR family transcriptional regulator n=1 Tax=Arsenicitalea aurantiaca TaxID=1783274 RepID=A0A433X2M9_9HYPH|nr:GntR family transcriptional regulator [Arsenicitalea aurantiaca]RUT28344.1 GntR family transcriptional regulator [Arsenicitalea aurantiaca]